MAASFFLTPERDKVYFCLPVTDYRQIQISLNFGKSSHLNHPGNETSDPWHSRSC